MQPDEQDFSLKHLFTPLTTLKAIHFIVIFGFIVYFSSLFNGFVWDDFPQLINNPGAHSITNSVQFFRDHSYTYYRPFSATVLAGMYSLFGGTAFWYHFIQLLLHIVNTILIYFLFKRFFSKPLSFFLSLIFLIHPINVESVAYISAIQSLISLCLGLVALLMITGKSVVWYNYVFIAFLVFFSALAKETGLLFIIIIPCFMLLCRVNKLSRKDVVSLLVTFLFVIASYLYLRFFFGQVTTVFMPHSPVPVMNARLTTRLLTLPKLIFYYLFTFIYPQNLAISQQWLVQSMSLQNFFVPLLFDSIVFAGLCIGFIFLLRKSKNKTRTFLFFAIWFFLNWAVVWQLVPLDMTVADRWFYVPMIGLLGILGIFIQQIKIKNKTIKYASIVVLAVLITLYSLRSLVRIPNWANGVTLYTHDASISNQSYELENELGYEYLLLHQYDKAKPHVDRSLQLAPYFWENWANLGVYYEGKGEINNSIQAFSMAIKNNNKYYSAYVNLVNVYYHYKSPVETKKFLTNTAILNFPHDPYFLYISSLVDYNLGNKQKAMDEIQTSYSLSHNLDLLNIYSQMKQGDEVK